MSNAIKIQLPLEVLETEHAKQMSLIAKEQVTARLFDGGDLYLFGSELACLRIAQSNKNIENDVLYSPKYKSYYCVLYLSTCRK